LLDQMLGVIQHLEDIEQALIAKGLDGLRATLAEAGLSADQIEPLLGFLKAGSIDWRNGSFSVGRAADGSTLINMSLEFRDASGKNLGNFVIGFDADKGGFGYYWADLPMDDARVQALLSGMLGFDIAGLSPEELAGLIQENDEFAAFLVQVLGLKDVDALRALDPTTLQNKLLNAVDTLAQAAQGGDTAAAAQLAQLANYVGVNIVDFERLRSALSAALGDLSTVLDSLDMNQLKAIAGLLSIGDYDKLTPDALKEAILGAVTADGFSLDALADGSIQRLAALLLPGYNPGDYLIGIAAIKTRLTSAILQNDLTLLAQRDDAFAGFLAKLLNTDVASVRAMSGPALKDAVLQALDGMTAEQAAVLLGDEAVSSFVTAMVGVVPANATDQDKLKYIMGSFAVYLGVTVTDIQQLRSDLSNFISGRVDAYISDLVTKAKFNDPSAIQKLQDLASVLGVDDIETLIKDKKFDQLGSAVKAALHDSNRIAGLDDDELQTLAGLLEMPLPLQGLSEVRTALRGRIAALTSKLAGEVMDDMDFGGLLGDFLKDVLSNGGRLDFSEGKLTLGTGADGKMIFSALTPIYDASGRKIGDFVIGWDSKNVGFSYAVKFELDHPAVRAFLFDLFDVNSFEELEQVLKDALAEQTFTYRDATGQHTINFAQLLTLLGGDIDFSEGELVIGVDGDGEQVFSVSFEMVRDGMRIGTYNVQYDGDEGGLSYTAVFEGTVPVVRNFLNKLVPLGTSSPIPFGRIDRNNAQFMIGKSAGGDAFWRIVYTLVDDQGHKVGRYVVGMSGNKVDSYASYDLSNPYVQEAIAAGRLNPPSPTQPEVGELDMTSGTYIVGVSGGETVDRVTYNIIDPSTGEVIGARTDGRTLTETQGWQPDHYSSYDLSKSLVQQAISSGILKPPASNIGFAYGNIPPPPPDRPRPDDFLNRQARWGEGEGDYFDQEAYAAAMESYQEAVAAWEAKYHMSASAWEARYGDAWRRQQGSGGEPPVDMDAGIGVEKEDEGTYTVGVMAGKAVNFVVRNIYDFRGNKIGTHTFGILKGKLNNFRTYNLKSAFVQRAILSGQLRMPTSGPAQQAGPGGVVPPKPPAKPEFRLPKSFFSEDAWEAAYTAYEKKLEDWRASIQEWERLYGMRASDWEGLYGASVQGDGKIPAGHINTSAAPIGDNIEGTYTVGIVDGVSTAIMEWDVIDDRGFTVEHHERGWKDGSGAFALDRYGYSHDEFGRVTGYTEHGWNEGNGYYEDIRSNIGYDAYGRVYSYDQIYSRNGGEPARAHVSAILYDSKGREISKTISVTWTNSHYGLIPGLSDGKHTSTDKDGKSNQAGGWINGSATVTISYKYNESNQVVDVRVAGTVNASNPALAGKKGYSTHFNFSYHQYNM
ncbi:MAG TPA: hypothetical protein P5079_10055, partial [Elusimicrobiota bacterium]|nr:hypothetical protein [Elusimicrobiota bacterium]